PNRGDTNTKGRPIISQCTSNLASTTQIISPGTTSNCSRMPALSSSRNKLSMDSSTANRAATHKMPEAMVCNVSGLGAIAKGNKLTTTTKKNQAFTNSLGRRILTIHSRRTQAQNTFIVAALPFCPAGLFYSFHPLYGARYKSPAHPHWQIHASALPSCQRHQQLAHERAHPVSKPAYLSTITAQAPHGVFAQLTYPQQKHLHSHASLLG